MSFDTIGMPVQRRRTAEHDPVCRLDSSNPSRSVLSSPRKPLGDRWDDFVSHVLERAGEPYEIASVALFYASDFVLHDGTVAEVTGGRYM